MLSKDFSVLIVTDNQYPPEFRVQHQVNALINNGIKVVVFCLRHDKKVPQLEISDNLIVYRLYINKCFSNKLKSSVLRFPFYTEIIYNTISKFLEKYKINIDAVQICDLPLSNVGKKLKKKFNIKLLIDFREPFPYYLEDSPHTKKFLGNFFYYPKLWRQYELQALADADTIICVIEESADRFPSFSYKMKIIPNVMDFSEFKKVQSENPYPKNRFTLIHFGELTNVKGCDEILYTLPQLRKLIPEIEFVITGDGKHRRNLEEIVHNYNLQNCVTFSGWVAFDEGNELIQRSNIGLVASRRCKHMDYTVPNKLYHYMTLEKPIIASDCPPVKRLVQETKCGLVYRTQDSFIKAVVDLYQHPSIAKALAENGRKKVEESYNWTIVGRNYANCFMN